MATHRITVLAAVVALAPVVLGGVGWGAEGHSNAVENVSISRRGSFVRAEASFKDVGAGSSKIAVWIDVYAGPGGPKKTTAARKSGTNTCHSGRTCGTLLRTVLQALPSECYVGRASTSSEAGTSEKQSPATGRLCP